MSVSEFILRVDNAIRLAEAGKSNLPAAVLELPGMSSSKIRHFLNSLAAERYLEVGVWQGSTFISACYGHAMIEAVAVDNFSQFEIPGYDVKVEFMKNIEWFLPGYDITVSSTASFFDIPNAELPRGVDVYFYDGEHSQAAQRKAISHAWPNLADVAIVVVDDLNMGGVREGIREGLHDVNAHPVREWELPARFNGDKDNWWNGLYVAVINKS